MAAALITCARVCLQRYSHEVTARDGYITMEEWSDYFQGVANKDETCPSNDVEASVEVRKKLEVFERCVWFRLAA